MDLPQSLSAPGYRAGKREEAINVARELVMTEPPGSPAHIVATAFLREVGARDTSPAAGGWAVRP